MPCRILVADDSTPIQKVIRIAFSKYHVEIATAGSLAEAIKESERLKPELVIADASLPGIAMASDFQRLFSKTPGSAVVILMGTYDAVKESDIRDAGLSTILKKPFDAVELLEASEKLLPGRLKPAAGVASGKDKNVGGTTLPPPPTSTPPIPVVAAPAAKPAAPVPAAPSIPQIPSIPGVPLMAGIPSFTLDDEANLDQPPGVPQLDVTKKGRPAFDIPISSSPVTPRPTVPQPPPPPSVASTSVTFESSENIKTATSVPGISAAVEEFVRKELPALVDRAVERYCSEHFKGLAREVLTTELRRLAEEKARYLVDQ